MKTTTVNTTPIKGSDVVKKTTTSSPTSGNSVTKKKEK